jgi:hypothetical protein
VVSWTALGAWLLALLSSLAFTPSPVETSLACHAQPAVVATDGLAWWARVRNGQPVALAVDGAVHMVALARVDTPVTLREADASASHTLQTGIVSLRGEAPAIGLSLRLVGDESDVRGLLMWPSGLATLRIVDGCLILEDEPDFGRLPEGAIDRDMRAPAPTLGPSSRTAGPLDLVAGPCARGVCSFTLALYGDPDFCREYNAKPGGWAQRVIDLFHFVEEVYRRTTEIRFTKLEGTCYFHEAPFATRLPDAGKVLDAFVSHTEKSPKSTLNHLLTTRTYDNGVWGLSICGGRHALSTQSLELRDVNLMFLLAHEIGHNFEASHQNDNDPCAEGAPHADSVSRGGHACRMIGAVALDAAVLRFVGDTLASPFGLFDRSRGCYSIMYLAADSAKIPFFTDGYQNDGNFRNNRLVMETEAQRKLR